MLSSVFMFGSCFAVQASMECKVEAVVVVRDK